MLWQNDSARIVNFSVGDWSGVRAHFVGEAFPPRVRDAAQERLVRSELVGRRRRHENRAVRVISSLTRFIASMSNGPCTDHDHTSVRRAPVATSRGPGSGIRATSLRNGRESLDRPVGGSTLIRPRNCWFNER